MTCKCKKYRCITLKPNENLDFVKPYITPDMNGIDVGSGGNPIFLQTISLDYKYQACHSDLVHLKGDARNLCWFRDGVLDYVYSSHCLEDFIPSDKGDVLKEWCRVIKPGGFLLLCLPTECEYREWCNRFNEGNHNLDHKDETFNINTVKVLMAKNCPDMSEVCSRDSGGMSNIGTKKCARFSFFLVYKKGA